MVWIALSLSVLAQTAKPGECVLEGVVSLKGDVTEAVVYLKDGPPRVRPEPQVHVVKQRDLKFVPNSLVVMLNDKITFVNDEDDVTQHSVFSLLGVDPFPGEINQRSTTYARSFSKEGPVHVQCNIHENMWLDVLVLRSEAFTRPDKKGAWRIGGLERKTYTVVAWEPNGGETRREVSACGNTDPVVIEVVKKPNPTPLRRDGSRYRPEYQDAMW